MKPNYLDNCFLRTGAPMFLSHQTDEFSARCTMYSENLDAPAYLAGGSTTCGSVKPFDASGSSIAFRVTKPPVPMALKCWQDKQTTNGE